MRKLQEENAAKSDRMQEDYKNKDVWSSNGKAAKSKTYTSKFVPEDFQKRREKSECCRSTHARENCKRQMLPKATVYEKTAKRMHVKRRWEDCEKRRLAHATVCRKTVGGVGGGQVPSEYPCPRNPQETNVSKSDRVRLKSESCLGQLCDAMTKANTAKSGCVREG